MKRSKSSEAQIAFILRQADEGTPVAEVCRKAGISDATFYNCRKRYGGLTPSEVKPAGVSATQRQSGSTMYVAVMESGR